MVEKFSQLIDVIKNKSSSEKFSEFLNKINELRRDNNDARAIKKLVP